MTDDTAPSKKKPQRKVGTPKPKEMCKKVPLPRGHSSAKPPRHRRKDEALSEPAKSPKQAHYVMQIVDPRDNAPLAWGVGRSTSRFEDFDGLPSHPPETLKAAAPIIDELKRAGLKPRTRILSWHSTVTEARAALRDAQSSHVMKTTNSKSVADQKGRSKITPEEEVFCTLIVEGSVTGIAEAYREAFGAQDAQPNIVLRRAAGLYNRVDIKHRIHELRMPMYDVITLSTDALVQKLSRVYEGAMADKQFTAAVAALREIGKLADLYPAQRLDVNVNETERVVHEMHRGRDRLAKPRQEILEATYTEHPA